MITVVLGVATIGFVVLLGIVLWHIFEDLWKGN